MTAKTQPGAVLEDPRWQVLRDIFGLDGSHDGIWHGVATPDQIITHVRYVADDRARLLKLATDRDSHPDQPEAPGVAAGHSREALIIAISRNGTLRSVCSDGNADEVRVAASIVDTIAALFIPSSDRIRQETAEERIREDERDRLLERARNERGITAMWLVDEGAMLPADRAAKRTEGGR